MATTASHIWIPSSARTVQLDSFVPVARGSTAVAPAPLNWAAKDPADTLDFQFDVSPALVGNDGDRIATLDVSISPNLPGDLALVSAAADGATAVMWFSNGVAGTTYAVTVAITTTNGRAVQRTILLPVLPLSTPPVPSNAVQVASNAVLTDQNGNPILVSPTSV